MQAIQIKLVVGKCTYWYIVCTLLYTLCDIIYDEVDGSDTLRISPKTKV